MLAMVVMRRMLLRYDVALECEHETGDCDGEHTRITMMMLMVKMMMRRLMVTLMTVMGVVNDYANEKAQIRGSCWR